MDLYIKAGEALRKATDSEICDAAINLARNRLMLARQVIRSVEDMKDFFKPMGGMEYEQFGAVFLDNRMRLLQCDVLFRGTVDHVMMHAREIVRVAITTNAANVIVFHNHPSGCIQPSPQDIQVTRQLSEALNLMDIRLADHVLIAGNKILSFVEKQIHIAPKEKEE